MGEIKISVPDSVLGEAKEKELKKLRSKIQRLEREVRELKTALADKADLMSKCYNVRRVILDEFGVEDYYDEYGQW